MKTIKLSFVALATLFLGTFVFTGCSEEGSTVTSVDSQTLNFRITNENAFLTEFYRGAFWRNGRTRTAVDSLDSYNVTEIIVGTDTRARGYMIKNPSTSELLYFADVDRTRFVLEIVDLITEEREVITDINLYPDYGLTHEFDVIQIIDDGGNGNVQPSGWFWGEYCIMDRDEDGMPNYQIEPATSGSPAFEYCTYTCYKRRLGISFGDPYTKHGGCGSDNFPH